MAFQNRIKQLREERNLKQEDLAKVLNFGRTAISNYESGRSEPNMETLRVMARFFDVSADYLMGLSDVRSTSAKQQVSNSSSVDVSGLPKEVIKQVEDYVEYLKHKYGTSN